MLCLLFDYCALGISGWRCLSTDGLESCRFRTLRPTASMWCAFGTRREDELALECVGAVFHVARVFLYVCVCACMAGVWCVYGRCFLHQRFLFIFTNVISVFGTPIAAWVKMNTTSSSINSSIPNSCPVVYRCTHVMPTGMVFEGSISNKQTLAMAWWWNMFHSAPTERSIRCLFHIVWRVALRFYT